SAETPAECRAAEPPPHATRPGPPATGPRAVSSSTRPRAATLPRPERVSRNVVLSKSAPRPTESVPRALGSMPSRRRCAKSGCAWLCELLTGNACIANAGAALHVRPALGDSGAFHESGPESVPSQIDG